MNILIDIAHPGHVHFYKNAFRIWQADGHQVYVTIRDIAIVQRLLSVYKIPYKIVSAQRSGIWGLSVELIEHTINVLRYIKSNNIQICTSIGGTYMIYAATLGMCRKIVYTDTETASFANKITFPFADKIATPIVFYLNLGRKQERYQGFHELAYLHPNVFSPDPAVRRKYDLKQDERFSLVRFTSWEAAHDLRYRHMKQDYRHVIVDELAKVGKVFVIPEKAEQIIYPNAVTQIQPEDYHDLLHEAAWCITEGATTASEACILSTPALYINPIVPGYINAIAEYGNISIMPPDQINDKTIVDFISAHSSSEKTTHNARRFIADHCDVTQWVVDFTLKSN